MSLALSLLLKFWPQWSGPERSGSPGHLQARF
jgi:hypothetical protein